MIDKALGLIETYGYTCAVEAADACLKAAKVEMIGLEIIGGGLLTIKILGDVSAVKASIDAGGLAAKRVGKVVSIDVISRMGEGLEKIINYKDKSLSYKNTEILRNMKVIDLRKLARQIKEIPLDKKQIKYAKKNELIDAIISCLKSKEE